MRVMIVSMWMVMLSAVAACGQNAGVSPSRSSQDLDVVSDDALVEEAMQAWSAGRFQEAFEAAREISRRNPDDLRIQLWYGEVSFAAGKVAESVSAYDAAIRLDPGIEPRLWQRGLALYYANRFADGVKQFETHQTVNSQDVENAVWHLLCASRVADVGKAREKLIPITRDPRVPMAEIYEMFAGRLTPDEVVVAAHKTGLGVMQDSPEHQLQQYYAWLYIGLYQEMMGESKAARESMKKAELHNPLGKTNFMGQVARVHLQLRDAVELNAD